MKDRSGEIKRINRDLNEIWEAKNIMSSIIAKQQDGHFTTRWLDYVLPYLEDLEKELTAKLIVTIAEHMGVYKADE